MLNKNNKLLNLFLLGSLLAAPIVINKAMFFIAEKKHPILDAFHSYDWRLGKVSYSVKGNGKPIVLIHGAKPGSSSAVWMKNTNELSEKYKVYCLDLLGYGTSDRVNTTYTAYTYASLINDFITNVVGKPAAVIAEGEGAMFALSAYAKNPINFKKLVLVCPKGVNTPIATNQDKKIRKIYELPIIGDSLYLLNTTLSNVRSQLRKMIFSKEKTKILTERFYSAAHYGGGLNKYSFASYKTGFMNTNIKPYIKSLKIPVLIVWGEKADDFDNFSELQGLSSKAEYTVFEDTASLPNYENSKEFNNLVIEFLNKVKH